MLSEGKRVCIAVMDIHSTEPDNNPYTHNHIVKLILDRLIDEIKAGDIKIIKIPPIESVNYGRDLGYDLNELIAPEEIRDISATKIREKL
jgi:hypothetical protein